MNSQIEDVKVYESRPAGSPVRVKADPDLVSDVNISCSTPTATEIPEDVRFNEELLAWESVVADLPSDDEDGEVFDKNVASLIIGMNMVQYLNLFKDADVGLNLFLTLTEDDLEVIGITDKIHKKDMAHGIANIRKKRGGPTPSRGLREDVLDATLSVEETIPVMCHTVKHINNLVVLLRNYRSRLNSNSVRNHLMDNHHSSALGAKILTKEALAQAELLKVQLHGMLLKLDPLRPEKFVSRKNKSANVKNTKNEKRVLVAAAIISAGISLLLALTFRKR